MTEHLVVLPRVSLLRLRRSASRELTWGRKQRVPPVGAVRRGDRLFFKLPGGAVVSVARVLRVRETLERGRYRVRLRTTRPRAFPVPFPVEKHDRRPWVVCGFAADGEQQPLLAAAELTLRNLTSVVKTRYAVTPSAAALRRVLSALLTGAAPRRDLPAVLLLVSLLLASREGVDLPQDILRLLQSKPARVLPLVVFSRPRARASRRVPRRSARQDPLAISGKG